MISAEQQTAIDLINSDDTHTLLVSSVAGSGKTSTLIEIAKGFEKVLYIAYNKSAQESANTRFLTNTTCKTAHGLAYYPIVTLGMGMDGNSKPRKIGVFNFKSITERILYDLKLEVIDAMNLFFASKYTSIKEFLKENEISSQVGTLLTKYVQKMVNKEIPCTHGFYLKYYHILLSRNMMILPEYDCIMLDELQDSNPTVLEIFKLLKANKKVGVGDIHQNIYSFNHTINGFDYLEGKLTHLTTSFRCSKDIAENIECFGQKYLDSSLQFKGVTWQDKSIVTEAYISRTNSALIAKMIKLNLAGTAYNLTRGVDEIFGLLLTLISLKPGSKPRKEYSFLMDDVEYYYNHGEIQQEYPNLLMFIANRHEADKGITIAIKTIIENGGKQIYQAYEIAKSYASSPIKHKLTLSTAHAAKGSEFDKVTLSSDLDLSFLKNKKLELADRQEELRLRYVAATRAKKVLVGAEWLCPV